MSVIIRLQNLPLTAGASDVRAFFTGLKIPDGAVHIIGGPEGDVFIGFASDEDARQAMRRDRMNIHEAEVRLYLSSKTEMNNVINQAKSGFLSPPEMKREESPKQSWQQQTANEPPANPFAARSGYSSSYPVTFNRSPPPPSYQRSSFVDSESRGRREGPRGISPKREGYRYEKSYGRYDDHRRRDEPRNISPPRNKPVLPFTTMPPTVRPFNDQSRFESSEKRSTENMGRSNDFKNKPSVASDSWRGPSFSASVPPINGPVHVANRNGPVVEENRSMGGAGKKPLLGNGAPPPLPLGSTNQNLPPRRDMKSGEKYYVELTRLPNELHRPAGLESFIRPSVPLTLSSAKVVFSREGVHVHTLVRLDSYADFEMLLKRDGEMGIKIRKTTQRDFDTAIEGIPVTPIVPDFERTRRRSRSPKRRRSRTPPPPRKRRTRSPEGPPPSRRRANRSPPTTRRRRGNSPAETRKDHGDPTRWCIQVTNVPFRCKEEELQEWFAEKVKPAKLSRTYYADGNASDRWIAEFSSESLMERAFSIKSLCQGRTLRMQYIANETADEILRIEDRYGLEKRQISEEMRENVDKAIPTSFFNAAPPPRVPFVASKPTISSSEDEGADTAPPTTTNTQPIRGGFAARGRFPFPPPPPPLPRGMVLPMPPTRGMFFPSAPSFNPAAADRGGFRGRFRGRGGVVMPPPGAGGAGRGVFFNSRAAANPPAKVENAEADMKKALAELISQLGAPGTVLSCSGFPNDVTLEDVIDFFEQFEPDPNSIRIRRDEMGMITGECMVACSTPENATQASKDLDGKLLRESTIKVAIAPTF